MMRVASICIGVALACLASSVATAADRSKHVELRAVVSSQCVIADEPFFMPEDMQRDKSLGLIGVVVGKIAQLLVEHAFKAAVNMWRKAQEDTFYATTHSTELYLARLDPAPLLELNGDLGCLTLVAGAFQPDSVDCTPDYIPRTIDPESLELPENEWRTSRTLDSAQNQLRRANICTDGEPRAVLEARFEYSGDGTAYRLVSAGHRVDSLLKTRDKKAERHVFYTVGIETPEAPESSKPLSTAWLDLGAVTAGQRIAEPETGSTTASPWLRMPTLSADARRAYDERTRVHQDTYAQIEALERAIVRQDRIIASLNARLTEAPRDLAAGLRDEVRSNRVKRESLSAELAARRAEYAELPRETLRLMPVAIRVALTESRSEKKAQQRLASIAGDNSGSIVPAAPALVARSISPPSEEEELRAAREAYYDVMLEARVSSGSESVSSAKARYNAAREAVGLAVLP